MTDLDDVLRRFSESLTKTGHAQIAEGVFELRIAVAMANELMAALDRNDDAAAALLTDMLNRQLATVDGAAPDEDQSAVDGS